MATLPVYRNQSVVTRLTGINVGSVPKVPNVSTGNGMQALGRAIQDVSVKWQEVQDSAEALDGKNKLTEQTNALLQEAQTWSGYNSPKEIKQKQEEMQNRLSAIMGDVTKGFTNPKNAERFSREYELTQAINIQRLNGLFRQKFIDDNAANLIKSEDRNRRSFIETGNTGYKQSYKTDLQNSFKAGFIDHETYQKKINAAQDWDKDRVFHIAETDPQAALDGVNADQFNINPTEKNEVLRTLNKMKTNKALSDAFQRELNFSENEANLQNYLFSDAPFADKRQMIDKMALMGEISDNYASKARTFMTNFNPKHGLVVSNPKVASGLLQRVADLNKNTANATDYLRGYNNIRADALEAYNKGELSAKDFQAFNNQLSIYSRGNVATNTQVVARRYKEVNDYLKNSLPADLRNQAFLEIWQEMDQIEMQGDKNETELKKMWREKSVEVTTRLATDRRLKATEAYADATNKSDSQFINELAKRRGTTPERTEKDIQDTMFLHGLTRDQVLNALKGNL